MFGGTKALVQALVAEKAINAELRTALARAESHFDWLASHVNELKAERAALLERTLGLQLAVPTIQRVAPTPADSLPGADPGYVAGKVLNIGDVLARARELAEVAKHGGPEPSIATPGASHGISFEDMGDDAAAAAGLRHAADGTVVYAR